MLKSCSIRLGKRKGRYQASLDRQQHWEQERQKEQAEWVERQRAWEQERQREQGSRKKGKRHGKRKAKGISRKGSEYGAMS